MQAGCVILVICVILGVMIGGGGCGCGCGGSGRSGSSSTSNYSSKTEAKYYAKDYILASLKSPSTADVSFTTVTESGNNYYLKGYVDAQNSFGAKLRDKFYVHLEYTGGYNYKLKNLQIGGEVVYKDDVYNK